MAHPVAEKVAVVTGSTQGLGEAVARRLIEEKMIGALVICGRNADNGRRLATELGNHGCRTHFVAADLARVEDCQKVIDTTRQQFNRIDYLVNCAATSERGTILDTSQELFDRIVALNVRAPFFLMQGALKLMLEHGIQGAIVNILSMSSHGGQPFLSPYSMSKGALATLTKNVANSVLENRIRVNGLNIGWMDTPGETAIQQKFHDAPPDWLEKAERGQPLGRLVKAPEVARVVAFLLSEDAGLMTGSIIDFDQQVLGTHS
ncbi:MAG TPA: SDR family oxidoreductase [Pirellulales bacterium]|jgi:NAD(P)-dependent dehydrogenase (short-subunit alcohol dehydrogenase family)|nr:SDR family oxidoreductase [Pirellulales bacterium]